MTSKLIDYEQAFYEEFGPFFEKIGLVSKWQEEERQKWTNVVADKDAEIADKDSVIASLRAQLESKK